MSFYDFDTEIIGEQLLPPQLRTPAQKSWVTTLLSGLQWIRDLFFDSYISGSPAGFFDSGQFYVSPDRVIMIDNTVWESLNITPKLGSVSNPFDNPTNWLKVQDVYIGVTERSKYNAQLIVYEYALNHWFQNTGAPDYIFIENNDTESDFFIMAESEDLSSGMSILDAFANEFMGVSEIITTQYDYTIWVPAGLWFTIGSTDQDRENTVRKIANKYNVAGMKYSVEPF